MNKVFRALIVQFLLCFASVQAESLDGQQAAVYSVAAKNYATLQQILPVYENAVSHPWPTISSYAGILKPGMKNHAVKALRYRLEATGELKDDVQQNPDYFDENLTNAVMVFKLTHGV